MDYSGLGAATSQEIPHLGGSITVGDPFTWCPGVWDYLIDRFGIRSAMDLGSGWGGTSLYFARRDVYCLAVDGFHENVNKAIYPTIQHDLTQGAVHTCVDLVHCQEVVEHIEEKYITYLLDSLLTGRVIVMTHAVPGQDGHHHVNLQSAEYWIEHLGQRGCSLLQEDTQRIRSLATRDGAMYMARTGMVFSNNNRV